MKRGTLWLFPDEAITELRCGIARWLRGGATAGE